MVMVIVGVMIALMVMVTVVVMVMILVLILVITIDINGCYLAGNHCKLDGRGHNLQPERNHLQNETASDYRSDRSDFVGVLLKIHDICCRSTFGFLCDSSIIQYIFLY